MRVFSNFAQQGDKAYCPLYSAGEIGMSAGTVKLNGYDVHTQPSLARRYIGYCPQYDGLIGTTRVCFPSEF